MKNLKIKYIITTCLIIALGFMSSCKKDKNVYADDFSISMAENPEDSTEIGTIIAETEKSYITYTLLSESVAGALYVDSKTGKLYVNDASIFNFEINPTITAQVEASNGKNEDIAKVTITITDVYEVPANIGDFRDGGVVFWVDPSDNTKGLVCALTDQAISSAEWGCYDLMEPSTIDGADGTAVGTGAQNTIDIIAGCESPGTAADLCGSLSLNGFSDWFLPSKGEMTEMYNNISEIDLACEDNGGTALDTDVLYWTSSEASATKAFDFYFYNGNTEPTLKLNYFSVRAVRAF